MNYSDETTNGQPLVELILDKAGQKGTGKWTVQAAMDLGVAVPTITAAVDARILSSLKDQRIEAAKQLTPNTVHNTRLHGNHPLVCMGNDLTLQNK